MSASSCYLGEIYMEIRVKEGVHFIEKLYYKWTYKCAK